MKGIIAVVLLGALAGCANQNVHNFAQVDRQHKTITVQPGSAGLLGKLKQTLANDGWKMSVYAGPSVTEGTVGAQTRVQQYDTFNTRYTLSVTSRVYDSCLKDFSDALFYDISMIDNQSGSEVFTMDGNGCESDVVKQFASQL